MTNDPNIEKKVQDLEKIVGDLARTVNELNASQAQYHREFGVAEVSGYDVDTINRTLGSIIMSTDGQEYEIGINSNPKEVFFNGVVTNGQTGTSGVRIMVVGYAQLGKALQLQPVTGSTNRVVVGGQTLDIIQCSTNFAVPGANSITPVPNVSEQHIVSAYYPSPISDANLVARASVSRYERGIVFVQVSLATGWSIVGNWILK